ncbi:MAG TPA: hypothetical protein VHB68_13915 [Steroidobacteraceae bacterium]|nr:hypothetical protein [Steroidobacteraceae bacterium]
MTAAETVRTLAIADLERVYDSLAEALDTAGPEKGTLFLVKLALLSANALADAALFQQQIEVALLDL